MLPDLQPYLATATDAIAVVVEGDVRTAARAAQNEVLLINGIVSNVVTHGIGLLQGSREKTRVCKRVNTSK